MIRHFERRECGRRSETAVFQIVDEHGHAIRSRPVRPLAVRDPLRKLLGVG